MHKSKELLIKLMNLQGNNVPKIKGMKNNQNKGESELCNHSTNALHRTATFIPKKLPKRRKDIEYVFYLKLDQIEII